MENLDYFYEDVEEHTLLTPAVRNELGEITEEATYDVKTVKQLKSVPESKPISDLERVIALGKPQKVIDKFAELVATTEQWDWFKAYRDYETQLEAWTTAKAEFVPESIESEFEEESTWTTFDIEPPVEPIRPAVRTGDIILAPYKRNILKDKRAVDVAKITVDVDGMVFDGDENSQARMHRAITILVGDQKMPWTLADNTVVDVTQTILKKALTLAGTKQSEIWHLPEDLL